MERRAASASAAALSMQSKASSGKSEEGTKAKIVTSCDNAFVTSILLA